MVTQEFVTVLLKKVGHSDDPIQEAWEKKNLKVTFTAGDQKQQFAPLQQK